MEAHSYNADSLADAFEMASKDATTWDFPAMEALAELAECAREGSLTGLQTGLGKIYACTRGQFKVYGDSKTAYGIALLILFGRESGIDDPAAAEILEYHRDRSEQDYTRTSSSSGPRMFRTSTRWMPGTNCCCGLVS